jgi:hypothetical protein
MTLKIHIMVARLNRIRELNIFFYVQSVVMVSLSIPGSEAV